MSPVSRGRKNKKSKNTSGRRDASHRRTYGMPAAQPQSAFRTLQSLLGPPRRPAWFDSANKAVLDRAGVV
ncbi:MAG: hypothetical protein WBF76_15290, partial [Pseudonocardiaceae bacterium]